MNHHSEVFKGHHDHCLNCGHAIHGNFCSQCGQNTHTHRLSIGHFIIHDLVHSVWHVDHGILFTLEEVLIRPGKAAMEYIRGKRVGRFPIITFVLIMLGINFWLYSKTGVPTTEHRVSLPDARNQKAYEAAMLYKEQVLSFIEHYRKWLIFCLLPVGSISSFIVFRKAKLNFTEHLVVNSYAFAGAAVVLMYMLLFTLCFPAQKDLFFELGKWMVIGVYLLAFYQAFQNYRILGLLFRFVAYSLLNFFIALIIVLAILAIWVTQYVDTSLLQK